MAFTIYILTDPVARTADTRACTIGIRQDTGTTYTLNVGGIPATTVAEVRTWLNANAESLYADALSRSVVMNLYRDADVKRLVKAYATINRQRLNQLRTAIINAATFADLKTTLTNTPAITAAADLQAILDEIDTDPST